MPKVRIETLLVRCFDCGIAAITPAGRRSLIGLDRAYLNGHECEALYRAGWLLPLEVDLLARVERSESIDLDLTEMHPAATGGLHTVDCAPPVFSLPEPDNAP